MKVPGVTIIGRTLWQKEKKLQIQLIIVAQLFQQVLMVFLLKKTTAATINSTLSESKLGLGDGLKVLDQCKDLIDEESRYDAQTLENYETDNSSSCQNVFKLVARGAKPTKCNENNPNGFGAIHSEWN